MRSWILAAIAAALLICVPTVALAQTDDGEGAGASGEGEVEADVVTDAPDTPPVEPEAVADAEAVTDADAEAEAAVEVDVQPEAYQPPPYVPVGGGSAPSTTAAASPPPPRVTRDAAIPLNFNLHGYYRSRFNWNGNVPVLRGAGFTAENAHYATMRLRLEPSVAFGSREEAPIAVLHMQLDGFDNVVWGDNARISLAPLFAGDPSNTNLEGFDMADTLRLERAWIEFLMPIGQIRIGRMASQWGMGLLANSGDGLGEWGDPMFGSTFDRVLFATRPLTVFNALSRGDARQTPLIYAIAFDKLVEHPVRSGSELPDEDAFDNVTLGPLTSRPIERPGLPSAFVAGEGNDVSELVNVLVWKDPDFDLGRESDELTIGVYYVWRWQRRGARMADLPEDAQASRVHIVDLYWKLQLGLGDQGPSFFTEGEVLTIQGRTNTVTLAGGCDDTSGICNETRANIWGAAMRVGLTDGPDTWTATLEWGMASGDDELFNSDELTVRPLHPDHHVGLLMYSTALATLTANGLGEAVRPLWSSGGVWNSQYFFPSYRFSIIPGIEVHAAVLVAWAHKLLPTVYASERRLNESTGCNGFDSDCFVGIEGDLALRFKFAENHMWWDTEIGVMRAGQALTSDVSPNGLANDILWTIQSRAGFIF